MIVQANVGGGFADSISASFVSRIGGDATQTQESEHGD